MQKLNESSLLSARQPSNLFDKAFFPHSAPLYVPNLFTLRRRRGFGQGEGRMMVFKHVQSG